MVESLFVPLTLRGTTFRNRLVVSPMCQYVAESGFVTSYHQVHYGRFALGGFGLVIVEATGVSPEGRITHGDVGLWDDRQIAGLAEIATFLKQNGAVAGLQLAHAGPKASTQRPFEGDGPLNEADFLRGEHAWPVVSASSVQYSEGWQVPISLDLAGISKVKKDFSSAARRALEAGFEVLELHCAHGYLLNSFLSPLTNFRTDEYGGDLRNRMRLPLEIATEIRQIWPDHLPLFVRISAVDGSLSGVTIEDSIEFSKELAKIGVDVVDCSSGGIGKTFDYPSGYGYQIPFAERIKREAGIKTMTVGLIVDAVQADEVIRQGKADFVALGREALKNPNFAFHAQQQLQAVDSEAPFAAWPIQTGWWLNARQKKLDKLGPRS